MNTENKPAVHSGKIKTQMKTSYFKRLLIFVALIMLWRFTTTYNPQLWGYDDHYQRLAHLIAWLAVLAYLVYSVIEFAWRALIRKSPESGLRGWRVMLFGDSAVTNRKDKN